MDIINLSNQLEYLHVDNNIHPLEKIGNMLSSAIAQRELVSLYADSQQECQRNKKLGMEVGMSREKDLIAIMKEYLGDEVEFSINNHCCEDVLVLNQKISIKHCSVKRGKGLIKIKWTSDNTQAANYINNVLDNVDEHCHHMIIVYISQPTIEIVGISRTTIANAIKELQQDAFVSRTGTNNRGIEYSKKMMDRMLQQPYFVITIDNVSFNTGMCPIEKRRALIHTRRQNM